MVEPHILGPTLHICPGATTTAAEARADGSATPWQLESGKTA